MLGFNLKRDFSSETSFDSTLLYFENYNNESNILILFLKAGIYKQYPIHSKINIRLGFETAYGKHLLYKIHRESVIEDIKSGNIFKTEKEDKLSSKDFYIDNSIAIQFVYRTNKNFRWILSCKNTLSTNKRYSSNNSFSIKHKLSLMPQLIIQFPL